MKNVILKVCQPIVFLEHFQMKNLRVTLNYIMEAQHGWILECPILAAKYIQFQFYKDIFHLDFEYFHKSPKL